jgi:hypothetical protein
MDWAVPGSRHEYLFRSPGIAGRGGHSRERQRESQAPASATAAQPRRGRDSSRSVAIPAAPAAWLRTAPAASTQSRKSAHNCAADTSSTSPMLSQLAPALNADQDFHLGESVDVCPGVATSCATMPRWWRPRRREWLRRGSDRRTTRPGPRRLDEQASRGSQGQCRSDRLMPMIAPAPAQARAQRAVLGNIRSCR